MEEIHHWELVLRFQKHRASPVSFSFRTACRLEFEILTSLSSTMPACLFTAVLPAMIKMSNAPETVRPN